MRTLNINKIVIEGFGSIATKQTFDLNRPGINIITGANGVGKTTLFNALYWCLFGKTSKGVAAKDIPTLKKYRPKGFKGTYVRVEAEINGDFYTILRTYKSTHSFSDLLVGASDLLVFDHRQGINITDQVSIRESQEVLERLLGIDSLMFSNSVFFGQKTARLMDTPDKDKRALFESILYSVMQDMNNIKERIAHTRGTYQTEQSEHKYKLAKLEGQKMQLDTSIKELEEAAANAEKILQSRLDDIDVRLTGLDEYTTEATHKNNLMVQRLAKEKEHKKELTFKVRALEAKHDIESLEKEYIQTAQDKRAKETEIATIGSVQLKDVELTIGGNCYACGSDITERTIQRIKAENQMRREDHRKLVRRMEKDLKIIEKKLASFDTLSELKATRDRYLEQIRASEHEIMSKQHEIERLQDNIAAAQKEEASLRRRREELTSNQQDIEGDLERQKQQSKEIGEQVEELAQRIDKLEEDIMYLDWWTRVGLGASGINTYLYESLLVSFNEALHKYSQILGIGVKLTIDRTKKSRPFLLECFDGGVVKSYEALSGGEQQRVNIGILFALYELVCSKTVSTNILLLDEVFEGLDEAGTSLVFNVLQTYADKSIYVITHNEGIVADYVEFITVKKERGGTIYL